MIVKNDFYYDKNIALFNNIALFEKINIIVFYTHFMKEKKNTWELNEHSHSFYELHIVLDGNCVMNIGNDEIMLKKYDYILIPYGLKHCFKRCTETFFRFSVAFDIVLDKNQTVCLEAAKKSNLEKNSICYINNVMREYEDNKIGIQNIINSNISALLTEILRSADVLNSESVDNSVFQPVLRKAALYIENNISRKITVTEVAENVFLSTRHLNRIFMNNFDMTVTQYIKNKKIIKAKEYLKKTNCSIKEIAYLIGTESDSAFCKFFKKETGISPKIYRFQNR